jgi:3-oxoacyl-[acyl-carrier protein] reductase
MADELAGKVALVTGGSRGIGRAIAIAFAREGMRVAVNYRERRSEAENVCREIRESGACATAFEADVSVAGEVTRLVKAVEAEFGPVSILVNNAGITRRQPVEEIGERDWDEIVTVNLKSQFLMIHAVLPAMRRSRWGRIINLSSVAAQTGGVIGPHYAASKAGSLGLTHFYSAYLAKEGITVNAIAPALILTDMIAGNPKARTELIPVGRFGTVEEVAEVAVMLARNGYVTGQTVNVNGGWYMC